MSVQYRLDDLLNYSDYERGKWRQWIAKDPRVLEIPFQSGGRFPTIGALLDHIILVERRHLARLQGSTPPEATGVPPGDWTALFEFADLVRSDFRRYLADLDETRAAESMTITIPIGAFTFSRRKLAIHMVLHEIRHFAQMAFAARIAGTAPPGEHDILFYSGID